MVQVLCLCMLYILSLPVVPCCLILLVQPTFYRSKPLTAPLVLGCEHFDYCSIYMYEEGLRLVLIKYDQLTQSYLVSCHTVLYYSLSYFLELPGTWDYLYVLGFDFKHNWIRLCKIRIESIWGARGVGVDAPSTMQIS